MGSENRRGPDDAADAPEPLDDPEVLAHISAQLRRHGVTARCAWCGRYRAGDGWFRLEKPPAFIEQGELSHGICPECVAELRARGLSA